MIGPPSPEAQPLGDEASGAGSQTASTQEVVDPAGVNGFVASQIVFPRPTFVIDNLEDFLISDRHIADRDRWSLQLLGKCFRYKDMELEDDPEFRLAHPSNCFKIHLLVHYEDLLDVGCNVDLYVANHESADLLHEEQVGDALFLRRMSQVKILFSFVRLVLTKLIMNG